MTTITSDIDVDVPVRTAYEQWTQFESFPEYLSGVEEVKQLGDALTHWVVNVGGVRREFDARIVDQVPDDHIAWSSVGEVRQEGRVTFRPLDGGGTRVELTMAWEPETFTEKAGAALGVDDMIVKRDLQRFKEFIEERHFPTGAWRGEVHGGVPESSASGTSAGASSAGSGNPGPRAEDVRGEDPDMTV